MQLHAPRPRLDMSFFLPLDIARSSHQEFWVLGASLYKSDTDRFRKDDEWYFVWWKGKDEKV